MPLKICLFFSTRLSVIENGFRKCGIFPYNPDAIDKSRLQDSKSLLPSTTSAATSPPSTSLATTSPPSTSLATTSLPSTSLTNPSPSTQIKKFDIVKKIIPPSLMDIFIFPSEDIVKKRTNRVIQSRVITSDEHRDMMIKKQREEKEKKNRTKGKQNRNRGNKKKQEKKSKRKNESLHEK